MATRSSGGQVVRVGADCGGKFFNFFHVDSERDGGLFRIQSSWWGHPEIASAPARTTPNVLLGPANSSPSDSAHSPAPTPNTCSNPRNQRQHQSRFLLRHAAEPRGKNLVDRCDLVGR